MKRLYLDLMEMVLRAYTPEHIERYTRDVEENGIREHGYARLTANIGILLAHGRIPGMKDTFRHMMDLCCAEIPTARERNGGAAGNDFAVKEIVLCLFEIEKAGLFGPEVTQGWRDELAKIDPYKTYTVIASVPLQRIGNWAAFGAASEQLRKYAGIGDESAFIENQIESQMFSFDENGMYRDPNEPMVYDLVTRLQLAVSLRFGFDGGCAKRLEDEFLRSADITLGMQSVTGEIPFGGRSNQFLHNEAFYAALCEFYVSVFRKRGDEEKAGAFGRAARKAAESIVPWLEKRPMSHIKNRFPVESGYGCEDYAYFDKYMVTAGSWLYLAYLFADDSAGESPCPSDGGSYVLETSGYFHKVFLKSGDYFAEYDTNADSHYDASGLGRLHRRGAPSALCLSVPFSASPNYAIDIENPSPFSICGGAVKDGALIRGCCAGSEYRLIGKSEGDGGVKAVFECLSGGSALFTETCALSDGGAVITVSGEGEVQISFPVFDFDGETYTEKTVSDFSVEVRYGGWSCRIESDAPVAAGAAYANRNGRYTGYSVAGKDSVTLRISMTPVSI